MSRKTTKCSRPRQVLPGLLQPLANQGIVQHQHGCRHTQQTQMEITTSPIPLYRAEPLNKTLLQGGSLEPRQSVRLPSNLPYVVDNLWEVMRPQHMPSRRHALYASTTPELAMTNCSANDQGQGFMVYQLVIDGPYSIAQIRQEDARDHPDKKRLPSSFKDIRRRSPTHLILKDRGLLCYSYPGPIRTTGISRVKNRQLRRISPKR